MFRTLLLWHLTATAALLAVYVLVTGLQWAAARLSGLVAGVRRRAPGRHAFALPSGRRDDEGAPGHLTRAA